MKAKNPVRKIIGVIVSIVLLGIALVLLIFGGIIVLAALQLPPCKISSPSSTDTPLQISQMTDAPMPNHPFGVVASPDGHWFFVSVARIGTNGPQGIVVLSRNGTETDLAQVIPLPDTPSGMAMTQDGSLLLATSGDGVAFIDVAKALKGTSDAVLGLVHDGDGAGAIEVILSKDERFAFVTDENQGTVSVIDMERIHSANFANAVIGRIPVDIAPVGMALSPDGKHLYITSEFRKLGADYNLYTSYAIGIGDALGLVHPAGTLTVVDVARAESKPAKSVIAIVSAGCTPVRVVLSPLGDIAWVTARRANTLIAFDTGKTLEGSSHAILSSTAVGNAPVGVTLIEGGKIAVVANSNRFENSQSAQTISLIDTTKVLAGEAASLGAIRVGMFPRELYVTQDGNTLLVTNYDSNSVTMLEVSSIREILK